LDALPPDLARQAITHASWTEQRSDSYERLAFLGDSVLGLAVTTHLYPRLQIGQLIDHKNATVATRNDTIMDHSFISKT